MTALTSRQRLLAIGLILSVTLVAFEVTAILTALPTITDELDGDSLYGVSLAIYTLANMVSLVAAGELADRRGPALPFVIAVSTLVVGLVVAGLAPSMSWVVAGRLLQGIGTGAFNPISYSLVRRAFPADRQPMMYTFLSAGWVLPSLIAPLIAGWITETFGWRWTFLSIIPVAVAVAAIAARPMADFAPLAGERGRSRVPLAVAAATGVGLFVTGLRFGTLGAVLPAVVVGLVLAVPALHRLLPPGYRIAAHGFAAILVARTMATICFGATDSFIPLAADRVHGASPIVQGFVIIGGALTWTLGQWISARSPHRSPAAVVGTGFVVLGLGAALSSTVLLAWWPLWGTFLAWCVGGFGMGLLFNPTTVAAMGYAAEGDEGRTSSQIALADSIGWSLTGGLGGAAVAAADRGSVSIEGALAVTFAISIVAAVAGVAVSRRIRTATPTATPAVAA
ncbi:MAG: MFS transporter [Ilumatobacteraceae bacterium]